MTIRPRKLPRVRQNVSAIEAAVDRHEIANRVVEGCMSRARRRANVYRIEFRPHWSSARTVRIRQHPGIAEWRAVGHEEIVVSAKNNQRICFAIVDYRAHLSRRR